MNIHWWRPTPEGIEPYMFPLFCVNVALAICCCVAGAGLAVVAGAYWQATISVGGAAGNSALLLWGVYRARQQELWRTRIEHDIDASSNHAAIVRLQREQLTRDMARYQSATSERRH
jgi:hypothetical protein